MKIILSNIFFKNIIFPIYNILKIIYENINYVIFDIKVNLFVNKIKFKENINYIKVLNNKYSYILHYALFIPIFSIAYMYFISRYIEQNKKNKNINKINQVLNDIN